MILSCLDRQDPLVCCLTNGIYIPWEHGITDRNGSMHQNVGQIRSMVVNSIATDLDLSDHQLKSCLSYDNIKN